MAEKTYSKEEIIKGFGKLITEINEEIIYFRKAYLALPENSRPQKEITQLSNAAPFAYLNSIDDTVMWGDTDISNLPNSCTFILYVIYNARRSLSEIYCMKDIVNNLDNFVKRYFSYVTDTSSQTIN